MPRIWLASDCSKKTKGVKIPNQSGMSIWLKAIVIFARKYKKNKCFSRLVYESECLHAVPSLVKITQSARQQNITPLIDHHGSDRESKVLTKRSPWRAAAAKSVRSSLCPGNFFATNISGYIKRVYCAPVQTGRRLRQMLKLNRNAQSPLGRFTLLLMLRDDFILTRRLNSSLIIYSRLYLWVLCAHHERLIICNLNN